MMAPGDSAAADERNPSSKSFFGRKAPNFGSRLLLSVLSFCLTCFTVTVLGPFWTNPGLGEHLPLLTPANVHEVLTDKALLLEGLSFSVPLLLILFCHEMGHLLACRRHGVPARPPIFLPAPFAIGTFGAFIRVLRPITSRRQLLDVGAAGPLAGFVVLLPVLLWGLSRDAAPGYENASAPGELALSQPLAYRAVESLVGSADFSAITPSGLHPASFAAWIGLLITAFNLLPLGQLDGGHILYAALGRIQHRLAFPTWCLLAIGGWWWPGWWVWSVIALLTGLKHPRVNDEFTPLGTSRRWIAAACLALLVLCISAVPIRVL